MSKGHEDLCAGQPNAVAAWRAGCRLFFVSMFILFLELACIRWFPAHVLFLTFFTNTVLLASFLGMSVGCLAANRKHSWIKATHGLLALAVLAALTLEFVGLGSDNIVLAGGNMSASQVVFFGSERPHADLARFVIPVEALGAFFFLVIALMFVGPGQELGRAFNEMPNRIQAYTINIAGSILSIALFAACSWCQLSPFWWFLPIMLGLAYFLHERPITLGVYLRWAFLAVLLLATSMRSGLRGTGADTVEHIWSPYYRIDYTAASKKIVVNQISHQGMYSRDQASIGYAYALPHLLNRDVGGQKFEDVLVIGAGSGNDVSRALLWGAKHIDAVEIDPAIHQLGKRDHPDRPYDDPRVTVHIDDGRNYLRSTEKQYDLIVYALVDSLVLHSSFSNIRLESYLFTNQAFADVQRRLKPGGLLVIYNFFRQGWIVGRIAQEVKETFKSDPLVLVLPYQNAVTPDEVSDSFTVFLSGDTSRIQKGFDAHSRYWVAKDKASANWPNGFEQSPDQNEMDKWIGLGLARVEQPAESLRSATDNWPFLYVRHPMLPNLSLRGMAVMGAISIFLIWFFMPRDQSKGRGSSYLLQMFFLGAGFMLIETNAVVHMALLFGSTWMVNSIVFFAVLVMILAANLFVILARVTRVGPFYIGLFLALILNCVVPLDSFLGMARGVQIGGSCLLVFAPIFFAGVIFAVAFRRSSQPDRAIGSNIAGAIFGGLGENLSMLIGFQYLVLVAVGFYGLSAAAFYLRRNESRSSGGTSPSPQPELVAGSP